MGGYLLGITSDNSRAFLLNSTSLVQIDLKNGNQFTFGMFESKNSTDELYRDLRIVSRSGNEYAVVLIREQSSQQYYVESHRITNNKTTPVSKVDIGILWEPIHYKNFITEGLLEDNNDEIYCLTKWYIDQKTTCFHLVHIKVDSNGAVSSTILVNNRSLGGDFEYPVISSNAIIWMPYSPRYQNISEHDSVRAVPLSNPANATDFG